MTSSRLGGVGHSPTEYKAIGAMFVDEEEEGTVHHEARLYRKWRKTHSGKASSLCSLFIHRDAALLLKLQNGLLENIVKKNSRQRGKMQF